MIYLYFQNYAFSYSQDPEEKYVAKHMVLVAFSAVLVVCSRIASETIVFSYSYYAKGIRSRIFLAPDKKVYSTKDNVFD